MGEAPRIQTKTIIKKSVWQDQTRANTLLKGGNVINRKTKLDPRTFRMKVLLTHTGLGIIQKLVSGWALTVEASSLVDAVMTTASVIAITFINIW